MNIRLDEVKTLDIRVVFVDNERVATLFKKYRSWHLSWAITTDTNFSLRQHEEVQTFVNRALNLLNITERLTR